MNKNPLVLAFKLTLSAAEAQASIGAPTQTISTAHCIALLSSCVCGFLRK
jgi:hypothetical protein